MWKPDKIIGAASSLGIRHGTDSAFAPDAMSNLINFDIVVHADLEQSIHTYLIELYNEIATAKQPMIFGGDHSIAIATWQAVMQNHGSDFGLLWIDAHLDANNFQTTPSGNFHGMPIATLLGHCKELEFKSPFKYLKPKNIYILGVRDYEKEEHQLLQSLGVNIYMMSEIRNMDFGKLVDEICSRHKKIGISFDCDSIDPEIFSSVNTPVPGGFSISELSDLLAKAYSKLICLEIAEYNPSKDIDGKNAKMIIELFSQTS